MLRFCLLVLLFAVLVAQESTPNTTPTATTTPPTRDPFNFTEAQQNSQPTDDPTRILDMPAWAFALIVCEAALVLVTLCACIGIVFVIIFRTRQKKHNNRGKARLDSPGSTNDKDVELQIKYGNELHVIKAPQLKWAQIKERLQQITIGTDSGQPLHDFSQYTPLHSTTLSRPQFAFSTTTPSSKSKNSPEQIITDQHIEWRKGDIIGRGATGKVYSGLDLLTGKMMAVKKVALPSYSQNNAIYENTVRRIESEIALMQQLHHPNVVEYLGMQESGSNIYIFLEYMAGGSLSSLTSKFGGTLPEKLIQKYLHQILSGLTYLHDNNVIHRDIKGANILMDRGDIKLADFGLSKIVEISNGTASYTTKGTPAWMAKEIILSGQYSFASDIWAVGCTIIEVLTGRPAWSELNIQEPLALMMKIATSNTGPMIPADGISRELRDLISKCLTIDPEQRPSAYELLQHPFLKMKFQSSEQVDVETRSINEFSDYEGTVTIEQIPIQKRLNYQDESVSQGE